MVESVASAASPDGTWAFSARAKADLFARAFSQKWRLPAPVVNDFFDCSASLISPTQWGTCILRTRSARCRPSDRTAARVPTFRLRGF
eukprot:6887623-Pyramimonas_sp.AAC.1